MFKKRKICLSIMLILCLTFISACSGTKEKDAEKVLNDVKNHIENNVGDIIDNVSDSIKNGIGDAVEKIQDNAGNVIEDIKDNAGNVMGDIQDNAGQIIDKITGSDDIKENVSPTETEKPELTDKPQDTDIPNVSESPSSYTDYRFRNKNLLNQHYQKHGIEMGFDSASTYEKAASDVINNPAALHKIEAEDGDDVYYIENTNEFVVLSKDGYIRTYFLPSSGKKYYDRQ